MEGMGYLCCFVVFVSFFEQGRRRHVEKMMLYKGGDWVKRGGGLRRGRLTMELGVIMSRQNFGFPVFAGSPSCSRCCVRARAEVDTSAGRLSEAKTQRRPRARERE